MQLTTHEAAAASQPADATPWSVFGDSPLIRAQQYRQTRPPFTEVGLRYSRYSEDSLDRDKLIFGSSDRYDIESRSSGSRPQLAQAGRSHWTCKMTISQVHPPGLLARRRMANPG